ncbi:DUF58 domain-containing protein [Acidocella sp.]|uniref:DUF58 domain-containing protein n=1 Tax=Acidocella sp. TaxID=50710 RepID=UPI002F3E47E4
MSAPKTLLDAQALAEGLPKLILAAERLAFVAAPGLHGRRRAGPGDTFWQFRDFRDGDDARRIDWRRSARGDRLYLKEREWEAQASLSLQLQDTPSLTFASDKTLPTKRERASLLLLALSAILLRTGERVSLYGRTNPLSGSRALPAIAAALLGGSGAAEADPDQRSRRVVFGDFLVPNPGFARQPGGAVMQILDPAECDFPYRGRILFEGFSREPELEAAHAESWAETYRTRLTAQRENVARAAMVAGQTPLFHRTDHPPAQALAAMYNALLRR